MTAEIAASLWKIKAPHVKVVVTLSYVGDNESLSIAYSILYGRLLEVASRHYFGKFDDFIVAYAPVLRSSIQRLKNNLVTDAKYYDNNYVYVRSIDTIMSDNSQSQYGSNTSSTSNAGGATQLVVLRDQSNCWDSP